MVLLTGAPCQQKRGRGGDGADDDTVMSREDSGSDMDAGSSEPKPHIREGEQYQVWGLEALCV